MPTAKQAQNANQTIRQRVEEELADRESLEVEATTVKDKVNGKVQPVQVSAPIEEQPTSRKFNVTTDDFFDYISKTVTPDEWTSGGTSMYIYKQAATGNMQLDRVFRPITFEEFRDNYVPKYGPGNYLLQFNTRHKALSACNKRLSFDGQGSVLGEPINASLGSGGYNAQSVPGLGAAIASVGEMLKDGAKTAVELSKSNQSEAQRPVDVAAIVTAISSLMPKTDNNFMVTMLENQRKDAEARADRAEKDAKDREDRARSEAAAKADRDEKFFSLLRDADDKRSKERDEFFKLILAEKDKKAEDSFGLLDALKDIVKTVVMDRIEGGPEAPQMKGWMGLIDKLAPSIAQIAGPLAAKMSGMPANSLPPIQTQENPVNGQAQVSSGIPSNQQLLSDLITRLVRYASTREQDQIDMTYCKDVVFMEYGPIATLIQQFSKEQILNEIKIIPIGAQMMALPQGQMFIDALLEAVKAEDGREQEVEPSVVIPNPKGRKQKPV